MPSEENDLDKAYSRYGKRLKSKVAAQDPTTDEKLRTRLEDVDSQTPSKSKLFAASDVRLEQLKEEFQIEVKKPQTLQEHVVYLLAQGCVSRSSSPMIPVADLYSEIHEVDQYRKLPRKDFQIAMKRLEEEGTVQLKEIQGTLVAKLRDEFLSEDEAAIMNIAVRKAGKASMEQIMLSTGWTQARVRFALDSLVAKKMVLQKKSFTRGTQYQVSKDA